MKNDNPFTLALRAGVLVFDGAMGTEIYRRHVFVNRCFDELCLSDPALIRSIHAEYVEAGADVLVTNSFGASAEELGRFGLADRADDINRAAVALAREAADEASRPVYVAASLGPAGKEFLPGAGPDAEVVGRLRLFEEAGADCILIETIPSRAAVEAFAASVAASGIALPVVLSVAVNARGEGEDGVGIERLVAPLPDMPDFPAAWGLNCGTGPDHALSACERAIRSTDKPLIVQPNAGMPRQVGNRLIYMCSPEYLCSYARRYVELGVRGVGGCCGTTPDHIREIALAVKPLTGTTFRAESVRVAEGVEEKEPSRLSDRSRLGWRLAHGKWVTTVELLPPRGYDLGQVIERARICHRQGVDAINIPDGPRASSRISPLVTAARIREEAGIEPVLHFCCRDRNLIGMQADLFACAALGVRNILFITGDPPKLGNYPFASGVFDADSIGLVRVQNRLNRGVDIGGEAVVPPTDAVIGVGADPGALDFEREVRRFREKAEAGAEFAITQPVFDPDALERFLDRVQDTGVPIIAGIWPLASYRNAAFMRNEVPGVVVPDSVMARMAAAESREDQRRTGIEIARETRDVIRSRVAGIQVSAPFGNVATALAVIEE